jgi:hypothetical protein
MNQTSNHETIDVTGARNTQQLHKKLNGGDEIIADIEISDGNCLKQVVEYFRNTGAIIPIIFYEDKMEIVRANPETTIMNKAVFDVGEFIVNYYVNPNLFNDRGNTKKVVEFYKETNEDGKIVSIEETNTVPDPRHIYIPNTDTFYRQCKTIAKKDGFRITIYKISEEEFNRTIERQSGSKVGGWNPDSYMKTNNISASSAPYGEMMIGSENVEEFIEYGLDFVEPNTSKPNQKVRLGELCATCKGFVRHKYEVSSLMVYRSGFRMKGGIGQSGQDFGWGTYKDVRKFKSSKIVIKGMDTIYDVFNVPVDLLKSFSKLQTIAGNGGVAAIYSNRRAMQIVVPISVIGKLTITIIPPVDAEEDEQEEKHNEPSP